LVGVQDCFLYSSHSPGCDQVDEERVSGFEAGLHVGE
jgi:hypothetical protein